MTMQHPGAIPSFRFPSEGRVEDASLADFPLEERILVVLAQQPWSSAGNLAGRLEYSVADIHDAFGELERKKRMAGRDSGGTLRIQRRYVLARSGVMHVKKPFWHHGLTRPALPLTWQMTEEGATRMLQWLPMIESLYEILPTLWTCGLAEPFEWQSRYSDPSCSSFVWMGKPTLEDVLWLPSGRLHVATTWRFDRGDNRPRYISVPFLWSGLLPQEDYQSRSLRLGSLYIRSARSPRDRIWWDVEPPVVAIGVDEFAAYRARTVYGRDVQMGSVDTAGTLVWSAAASHNEWTLRDELPQARAIVNGAEIMGHWGGVIVYH